MLWPKKNSDKEFNNKKKKFLRLENSPPPPMIFLMVRPLLLSINTIKEIIVIISIKKKPF